MKLIQTKISEVIVVEPAMYSDGRGFLFENFNTQQFNEAVGCEVKFVQGNYSQSAKSVLLRLCYQIQQPQGKMVRVVRGAVFDVVVDIKKSSLTCGLYVGVEFGEQNRRMQWMPEGFAHGFLVLSDSAEFLYKTTDYWASELKRSPLWGDESLSMVWSTQERPVPSAKDSNGTRLEDAEVYL